MKLLIFTLARSMTATSDDVCIMECIGDVLFSVGASWRRRRHVA